MTNKNKATEFPLSTIYTYADVECPIRFKYSIGIVGIGAIVTQIIDNIIDSDGYYPYFYNNALYGNILTTYSDFRTDGVVELDKIINDSDIKDVIKQSIDYDEFMLICDSVDKMIEFKKQQLANKSEFDGLISDVRKIVANLNENYIKPLKPKTFEKLINNLSKIKLDEKSLVNALVDAKVIDKKFPEKENKEATKGKIINFAGQQVFNDKEIENDEIE